MLCPPQMQAGAGSRLRCPGLSACAVSLKGRVLQLQQNCCHDLALTAAPAMSLQDSAEFGRIGRYYATESMLLYDPETQQYLPDATPSYGRDSLEDFFRRAVKEDGLKGQDLGDAAVF